MKIVLSVAVIILLNSAEVLSFSKGTWHSSKTLSDYMISSHLSVYLLPLLPKVVFWGLFKAGVTTTEKTRGA